MRDTAAHHAGASIEAHPVETDGDASPEDATAQLAFRTSVLEAQSEAVNDGLLLVSPTGRILSYNRRFAEQWGFDEAVLAGLSDDDALDAAVDRLRDRDAFLARVRYLYDHPDERSTDELQFLDGRVLERFSAPVRGADGTYYGRVWSFRDITEQRAAEQALARRVVELSALFRFTDRLQRAASLDQVYGAAIDAIVEALECDRASLLLFDDNDFMGFVAWRGLSDEYRGAVNGHTPWTPEDRDAEPITVEDIAASDLEDSLKQTVLKEGIRAFAFVPLVGGRRLIGKFMLYYDRPHEFVESEISLALTVARQIAFGIERRRADEERDRAEQALREADRRKDEFLATLAHELRNPLAPLHNALPLLRQRIAAGASASDLVEVMSRQTSRLRRLVDDLMDVARITSGHIDLRREVVDVRSVVEHALVAVDQRRAAPERTIDRHLPDDQVLVVGDPERLEQVVNNLVANAVKYSDPESPISVTVSAADGHAHITVTDAGIGIDHAFINEIFEPFQQADRSLDRSQGGLGMGLTVVRRLVELHGGSIEARSDGLGAGSTFAVRLPLAAPDDTVVADAESTTPQQTVRRRVLVVDDNRDQTAVLAELIDALGHEVHVAHDGAAAIELVQRTRPDIALLDVGLPGFDGYELAEALRRDPANVDLLLIAVTGYSQPSDKERSKQAGFDAHVVKPIELELLERVLASGTAP